MIIFICIFIITLTARLELIQFFAFHVCVFFFQEDEEEDEEFHPAQVNDKWSNNFELVRSGFAPVVRLLHLKFMCCLLGLMF